jgi:hypothetical protein
MIDEVADDLLLSEPLDEPETFTSSGEEKTSPKRAFAAKDGLTTREKPDPVRIPFCSNARVGVLMAILLLSVVGSIRYAQKATLSSSWSSGIIERPWVPDTTKWISQTFHICSNEIILLRLILY